MVSRKISSSKGYSDPSEKWMSKLCIEPPADSQTCALAVFCPCILVGKIRWRIKQKELNLDPLQSAWHRKYSCNSSCCSSTFCLCPWYVKKFHSNIRSLYAIGGKKNSNFKNCLCCTCTLLQLDREIRAREGETRLRTNQRYNIDPVLTQPEISLPMKYISPFEAKARSNCESPTIGAGTTKIRKVPNPTKRFTTEKALERRLFILRDVYSHGALAVERPLGVELESQNHSHSERSSPKLVAPLHWKIKLTECGGDSSNKDFSSSEYPSMLLTGKSGKLKRFLSPELALTNNIGIDNSNENLSYSRSITSSNLSTSNSLESLKRYYPTEDQWNSLASKPYEDEVSIDRNKKFDVNSCTSQDKTTRGDSGLDKIDGVKMIEGNHSTDLIDESAVTTFNVGENNPRNLSLPIIFPEPISSCHSQIYSATKVVNNETQNNQPNFTGYKEKPEKLKLMSYRTISSATLIDIPKSRSQRESRDKVCATLASGAENLSINGRSVIRRPKWHSSTFVAPDESRNSTGAIAPKSAVGINLQIPPLDTENFIKTHHLKPPQSEDKQRQESDYYSTSICGSNQKISLELSDPQEIRLNHISKLPICINREIKRNQPFNRPRLSPILSNENIYRQPERKTRFLSYSDFTGRNKEKKYDHNKYNLSNSLHPAASTNKDVTTTLSAFLVTEHGQLIPRAKIVSGLENAKTSGEIEKNPKANDKEIASRGQAAQKALRLILVRTPSGATD